MCLPSGKSRRWHRPELALSVNLVLAADVGRSVLYGTPQVSRPSSRLSSPLLPPPGNFSKPWNHGIKKGHRVSIPVASLPPRSPPNGAQLRDNSLQGARPPPRTQGQSIWPIRVQDNIGPANRRSSAAALTGLQRAPIAEIARIRPSNRTTASLALFAAYLGRPTARVASRLLTSCEGDCR